MYIRMTSLLLSSHTSKLAFRITSTEPCYSARLFVASHGRRRASKGCYSQRTRAAAQLGEPWSIYDDPALYDHVFPGRDFAAEVDFLFDVFQKHAKVGEGLEKPNILLELGCGPARHSIQAVQRGASRAIGVDNSAAMLGHARHLAAEAGVAAELVQGTLGSVSKTLQLGPQAHVAYFLFGTLCHALTNEDALAWLRDAAACVAPGGLIVAELEHPGDIFDGTLIEGDEWPVDGREPEEQLMFVYGTNMDDFNPVTQVHTRTVRLTRRETSRKKWELIGECSVEQKAFTVSEVALLAKLVPLEVAWYYGDLDIEVDSLFHESASRMVVILRKPLDSGAV
ncbi:hypothetical protein CVIRNUC_005604 [Coccomyxa viridis]|uniref:Methyltransferase domain-containing protein n=1 Tax=Coccomyxa viridis TaxID=1274662 RepID=A0AAV1I7B1_9CHLO|nr:hypothetical protein CVIRNUC_005604 [Coccomyxa viridis]